MDSSSEDRGKMKANEEKTRLNSRAKVQDLPNLPEEIVEKIISKMPFPSMFQARVLSRDWYFKLPFPSQRIRSSLQNLISAESANWPSYCPIFISRDVILGFEPASSRWRPIMSLSYLSNPCLYRSWLSISCCGSLICIVGKEGGGRFVLTVTNVLTRSDKDVYSFDEKPTHVRLVAIGDGFYKLIVIHTHGSSVHLQVFDSKRGSWRVGVRSPNSEIDVAYFFERAAYSDGKFYGFTGYPYGPSEKLWTFHVADFEWSSKLIQLNDEMKPFITSRAGLAALVFCGGKLIMCACSNLASIQPSAEDMEEIEDSEVSVMYIHRNSIILCELDLESLELKWLSSGPDKDMVGLGVFPEIRTDKLLFASHGCLVYFCRNGPGCPVVTFDVHTSKWDCLAATQELDFIEVEPWGACAFQPGLNPFVTP